MNSLDDALKELAAATHIDPVVLDALIERIAMRVVERSAKRDLLTINQLASVTKVSRETVKRWMREGAPREDLGPRMPRFVLEDVLRWRREIKIASPVAAPKPTFRRLSR